MQRTQAFSEPCGLNQVRFLITKVKAQCIEFWSEIFLFKNWKRMCQKVETVCGNMALFVTVSGFRLKKFPKFSPLHLGFSAPSSKLDLKLSNKNICENPFTIASQPESRTFLSPPFLQIQWRNKLKAESTPKQFYSLPFFPPPLSLYLSFFPLPLPIFLSLSFSPSHSPFLASLSRIGK